MTNQIKSESDKGGCLPVLPPGNHNKTPTDKISSA